MSVTITFASTVIANGASDARQSPRDLRILVNNVVQPVDRIRAAAGDHIDRGNTKTSISFQNTIEHSTVEAAMTAATETATGLPKTGLLQLQVTGGTEKEISAKLIDHEHWHVGVSSFHRYSFIGGVFS